jgi:hypothetical protein
MAAEDQAAVDLLNKQPLAEGQLASLQQLGTNDFLTLRTLGSPSFDPAQTVLLASSVPGSTNAGAVKNAGTVAFTSYACKDIKLQANCEVPAVLLLNDRYDPNWQVWVDGKRAELLRCNFIMRGVHLPAGSHTVEFIYRIPLGTLYVSLAGVGLGILTLGYLAATCRCTRGARLPEETTERASVGKPARKD